MTQTHAAAATEFTPGALAGGVMLTIHRWSQGGADRVAMLLANGFRAAGLPVGFAVLRDGGEGRDAMLALADPGVAFAQAGAALGSRHLELLRGRRFIARQAALARPAVVIASSSNMGLVTALALRGRGAGGPATAMKLTNPVVRPRTRSAAVRLYRRRLYDFIFGQFDQIWALDDAIRTDLILSYPALADRFAVAANPYVTPRMLAPTPIDPHRRPATILSVARLMPQKRLDRLLRAFAQVPGDSQLVILGEGPARPALERLVAALGLAGRVTLAGFAADVVPFLRCADLLVLSSDYEGLPAVALEALASGVPVVTTDSFLGARDLLADAPGCAVVPIGDRPALAAAIARSLAAPRDPAALRARALPYTRDAAVAAHLRLVRALIERAPGAVTTPGRSTAIPSSDAAA